MVALQACDGNRRCSHTNLCCAGHLQLSSRLRYWRMGVHVRYLYKWRATIRGAIRFSRMRTNANAMIQPFMHLTPFPSAAALATRFLDSLSLYSSPLLSYSMVYESCALARPKPGIAHLSTLVAGAEALFGSCLRTWSLEGNIDPIIPQNQSRICISSAPTIILLHRPKHTP